MDLRSIINNEGGENSRQNKAQPATPVQARPSPGQYREYSQHSQPSLGGQASQDYGAQTPQFAPLTAYQGGFQGRPPAPPPIQPPNNDLRSPAASSHYSAQSPFRNTPSSSTSGGQYPFPQNITPHSPAQAHQYTNSQNHRESYPHSDIPPQPQRLSYPHASPVPLTPPIGTANNTYPFLQNQRSQSAHSNSTPTSAQSQSTFYPQQLQESPLASSAFHEQPQRSQPPTPLGPPISQRSSTGGHPLPTSPYQQRSQTLGVLGQEQTKNEQISPSPSIQAAPVTPSSYNQNRPPMSETRRISESEREHSMSVSPKTTVFGMPRSESLNRMPSAATSEADPGPVSSKRKMDDRQSSESRTYPNPQNGDQSSSNQSQSPQQRRKRRRYNEPPIWARSWLNRPKNQPPAPASIPQVNVKQEVRAGPEPSQPQIVSREHIPSPPVAKYDDLLGPWEPSISDSTPVNDLTKAVADFLYIQVVNRPDWGELESRGVQVEIEAKLGQLIDKETNQRYYLPVATECVLAPSNRISFRSSMTEEQHRKMNGFLNDLVTQTHPSNVNRPKPRVPIEYSHRRERDSFYELPQSMVQTLPPTIQHLLKQSARHSVKVRVSHDQKTGQELAKIIKTRVQDLNIYIPNSPLDCRISVNLEMRYDGDVEALARGTERQNQPDRNKDRMSYTQSHYQIDLTQVTSATGQKEHELEIEIETKALLQQGMLLKNSQRHKYDALVEGLINNIHVLTKELTHFEQKGSATA